MATKNKAAIQQRNNRLDPNNPSHVSKYRTAMNCGQESENRISFEQAQIWLRDNAIVHLVYDLLDEWVPDADDKDKSNLLFEYWRLADVIMGGSSTRFMTPGLRKLLIEMTDRLYRLNQGS